MSLEFHRRKYVRVLYEVEKYNLSEKVFDMFESSGYDLIQIARQSIQGKVEGDELLQILETGVNDIKRVKCLQTLSPGFAFPVVRRLPIYPDWSSMFLRGLSTTIVCILTPRGEWTLVTMDNKLNEVYKNYCEYHKVGHPLLSSRGQDTNVLEYMRLLLHDEDPCFRLSVRPLIETVTSTVKT
jgi:hypothetical protein